MGIWTRLFEALGLGLWGMSEPSPQNRPRLTPSTLFAIQHARSVDNLLAVITERADEIEADNICLAHLRLVASNLLLTEVMQALGLITAEVRKCREEIRDLVNARQTIWTRFNALGSNYAYAEELQQLVDRLDELAAIILQFIGMHTESIEAIRSALGRGRADDLARAIVAACRQVSSFMHAVLLGNSIDTLRQHVGDAVRSSVSASSRRDLMDQTHAAEQLGQFWNQNGFGAARQGMAPKDVRLTLQILRQELASIRTVGRRLWRAVESDAARAWRIRRYSLLYAQLLLATAVASRAVWTRARITGGTGELEDAIVAASEGARRFATNNVVEPTTGLYKQVFQNTLSAVSRQSVAQAKMRLTRMLVNYTQDHLKHIPDALQFAKDGNMDAVMESYVDQVRSPVRNLVFGTLTQTMLLQVQQLKCDVEELVMKSKQQLQAQELNLALLALIPAIFVVASVAFAASRIARAWRSRGTELVVSAEQTIRFLLGSVYDTLILLREEAITTIADPDNTPTHLRRLGELNFALHEVKSLVEKRVLRAPPKVLDRFMDDIVVLESRGTSLDCKIKHLHKMWSCYPFFMPLNRNL